MRGLLMKDLQLMKVNKRMLFIIVALAVVMLVMGNSMNSFVIGYVTLVFAFQVLTTITYDEYDQSGAFLMTMPVTRTLYTLEKYVFAFLSMALGWGGVVVLSAVFQLVSKTEGDWIEWLVGAIAVLTVALVLLAISIPVQLRFGGENGRIVIMTIVVVCVVAFFLFSKVIDIELVLEQFFGRLSAYAIPVVIAILVIMYLISICVSLRIVKKKEY